MSLEGKVAIVTGGARGTGRAIVETLAQRGADVVIGDWQLELAQTTAQEVAASTGRKIVAIQLDVSNSSSSKAMAEQAIKEFEHIDILVNNAGTTRDNLLLRMDESDWDTVLNINLKGAFNCSKAVLRQMMKQP